MKSLDDMFNSGLYINDLSMHDSSRDLVLAGTQQSAELKLALDQVSDVTVNDIIVYPAGTSCWQAFSCRRNSNWPWIM